MLMHMYKYVYVLWYNIVKTNVTPVIFYAIILSRNASAFSRIHGNIYYLTNACTIIHLGIVIRLGF